jgi:DNA polymerase III delta subunit
MLYVYFGTDTQKTRENAHARMRALAGKQEILSIQGSDYRPGIFVEHAGSVSLFGDASVTCIDTMSENEEAFEALIDDLPILQQSSRVFVIVEGGLNAAEKKLFQKYAAEYEEAAAEKKERFNTFALTDAFLAKDKKSLWLLLADAVRAGVTHEAIIGLLFWQINTARLVAKTGSAEEAGIKPFVYSKTKRALAKFTQDELHAHSRALLSLYHEGHLGKRDIGLALEAWVLAL